MGGGQFRVICGGCNTDLEIHMRIAVGDDS